MLEDDFTWVIRKAFKGLALAPGEAALRAGLPEAEVLAFSRGKFSEQTARRLAPALGLNPDALAKHPTYQPAPLHHPAITRLDLPFGDGQVNAWLIRDGENALLFDAGAGPDACIKALGEVVPDALFITHSHADHTGGIDALANRGVSICGVAADPPLKAGEAVAIGRMGIQSCDLSGHADPALGFHVTGLDQPVLVVGDALFAGSIGGCSSRATYHHALMRLRAVIEPLPEETILLPGHGPATSVGEERRSNPFL